MWVHHVATLLCLYLTTTVKEDGQSPRNAGISEALTLALRARQEAEWEMDGEESS